MYAIAYKEKPQSPWKMVEKTYLNREVAETSVPAGVHRVKVVYVDLVAD